MANDENLKPFSKRSVSEARECGKKGGTESGKKRREIKTIREYAQALMNSEVTDKNGKTFVFKDALIQKLGNSAFNTLDLQTIKFLCELIGEAPSQRVEVTGKDGQSLMPGANMTRKEILAEIKRLQKNRDYK
jgi:hypothetical protein